MRCFDSAKKRDNLVPRSVQRRSSDSLVRFSADLSSLTRPVNRQASCRRDPLGWSGTLDAAVESESGRELSAFCPVVACVCSPRASHSKWRPCSHARARATNFERRCDASPQLIYFWQIRLLASRYASARSKVCIVFACLLIAIFSRACRKSSLLFTYLNSQRLR